MVEPAVPRRPLSRRILGDHPTAWALVLPAAIIIVGLAIVPIGWSFVLSLHSADLIAPAEWVGLSNYDALLDDPGLRDAIGHTLVYTALFVPLSIGLGLLIALALNHRIRFIGIYRTLILAPFIASVAAQGVLFSFIFDERFGVANAVLDAAGLPRQGFLGDPDQALFVIVLIGLWGGIGFPVVILPRGAAGRAARPRRRRVGRRRAARRHPLARDPPATAAGHRVPGGLADAVVAAAVRPGLRDDARRPARCDGRRRLLHLQPGVRAVQRRLRRRGRVRGGLVLLLVAVAHQLWRRTRARTA